MKLSILIPTYNRCNDLRKNLELLCKYIKDDQLESEVCICVSDNASTDDTSLVVQSFCDSNVSVAYYCQQQNVGYCNNLLYVLSKATTDWVMLLGDDDYLCHWYINACLNKIKENPKLGCIIANYINYYPTTNTYGSLREDDCETMYYQAGFDACLKNIWRAHQLSGLCFRRTNLVEEYRGRKMNNLYPQMFFVGYNSLKYDVLHFGEKCLMVSKISQNQKDWNYGEDGLVNDIFENFINLNLSYKQKSYLEFDFLNHSPRYIWATNNTNLAIEKILSGSNTTFLGRYYIAHKILQENIYSGRKLRFCFYLIARFVLLRKLFSGKSISL